MKPKTHTWTEAEVEALAGALESMRDLYGDMTDYIKSLHDRLFIAETWIEQHKVEAAAFKERTEVKDSDYWLKRGYIVTVKDEGLPPAPSPIFIQAPVPLVDGPNVIHHKKWSDIKHKAGLKPVHDPPGANIDDLDFGGES